MKLHVAPRFAIGKANCLQGTVATPGLLRHVRACNNAILPGGRVAVLVDRKKVGWIRPDLAASVTDQQGVSLNEDGLSLAADALAVVARRFVALGLSRWRGEAFDVRAVPEGHVLGQVDRGALPLLGIQAEGVHLNGLVRRGGETLLWVARRAADKALDPGKLDHIVAGGVPSGLSPWRTLLKEAGEEAALPKALAARAVPVAVLSYTMERAEGLRRDRLHCYDLVLPEDFVPVPADGEVQDFALWPLSSALQAVRETDCFKFNVNLVLIDLFLREGLVDPEGAEGRALRTALDEGA